MSLRLIRRNKQGFLSGVMGWRSFLKYWLPPLIWMAVIFAASSDAESSRHSSRIIAPLLHWLAPDLSQEKVDEVVFIVRKCAHLTEYAILAGLLWRAFRKPVRRDPRPWSWRPPGKALLVVALYASSDEIHQLFVPTRTGNAVDVIIDSTGGALGLLAIWVIYSLWKKPLSPPDSDGAAPAAQLE